MLEGAGSNNPLIQATDGNFYGATTGDVFKITPAGDVTVLYTFGTVGGTSDAYDPHDGLIQGADGNFYGTTFHGGANSVGTVFKITPSGVETVLHSFGASGDGTFPAGGLVQGTDGNFYGTTSGGGVNSLGTVFKVTPSGVETVLHSFGASTDGDTPYARLTRGTDGNFYGTTFLGGATGDGTVFKITPAGVETILHSFGATSTDATKPTSGVIQATDGNFYGTTSTGGTPVCLPGCPGLGTVFKVTPLGSEEVLYSFDNSGNGSQPHPGLIQGADGNFYGTTVIGGANNNGTVFKITTGGVKSVLYSFGASSTDAKGPDSALVQGTDGNLYGVTSLGGGGANNYGAFYRITP